MTIECKSALWNRRAGGSGMRVRGWALISVMLLTSTACFAGEIDQMASNLQTSCSNHFGKRPNRPSADSKKFCSCFANEFTATISLREIDAAGGALTPEIQDQFERAAESCGRDIAPAVAQAGRAWAMQDN